MNNRQEKKKHKKANQVAKGELVDQGNKNAILTKLPSLSLDELANNYLEIDKQSHLLRGNILLAARNKIKSDKEFGQWITTHSLCVGNQQSRNRLMNLAKFFTSGRDMEGICISPLI